MRTIFPPVVIGVPDLSPGDAVSNDVLGMYQVLESIGVDVRLLPSDHANALGKRTIRVDAVPEFLKHDGLYIYHFCAVWPHGNELLSRLRCVRIVKYHNVTPPHFFEGTSLLYVHLCREGRADIRTMAGFADCLWSDSRFNQWDFEPYGLQAGAFQVLPPFHQTDRLLAAQADPNWLANLDDDRVNILFVGRLAPNKNHPLLIDAFAIFKRRFPKARLLITGGRDPELSDYISKLDNQVATLGLQKDILFLGKVSNEILAALYRKAHLFAIASLHEGFCVPLLEAMAFNVPIVALSRCAIPESAQNAAEYCEEESAEEFACAMIRALDTSRADELKQLGHMRYSEEFSRTALEVRFLDAITPLLVPSPRSIRAVHQFHSGSANGDAITNGMLFARAMLLRMGFASEIYVEHIAPGLERMLHSYTDLEPRDDEFVLIHHSMGHNLDAFVKSFAGHGALVYHNITPAKFFTGNPEIQRYIGIGLNQLDAFSKIYPSALADSTFNAHDLHALGYQHIEVLPLLFNLEELRTKPWNDALAQANAVIPTILFVGRIAPNKHPHELVEVAVHFQAMFKRPFQLILVGGADPNDEYYLGIKERIAQLGLHQFVKFAGKVSDADLAAWYRAADIFITLSEHEGFCVPVIEAFANDVPVIAFNSGALDETMGCEGFTVRPKDPAAIAALCKLLLEDRALRRAVIEGQRVRLQEFERDQIHRKLAGFLRRQGLAVPCPIARPSAARRPPRFQVEGPYETSYSLALVNREMAKALDGMFSGQVGLFATEGPGDYEPDMRLVNAQKALPELKVRGYKGARSEVCIRNLYPPRVADMDGLHNFLYFAWEETGLSPVWVADFNTYLDGMPVLSEFVRKVLIDNGVVVPSTAAGCGVNHILEAQPTSLPDELTDLPEDVFVLLHVSSCFPRKGIDILLDSYGRAIGTGDNVVLVIKTFPNPHNTVEEQISQLKSANPNYPNVIVINRDIPSGELASLYQRANAFVAPTRGEGFGLPMAEAMALGVPVITTAYGGQSDFCTPDTAWLIDYRFAPAETHMGLYNSLWVEPDADHLSQLLTKIVGAPRDDLKLQVDRARALINSEFTWHACAARLCDLRARVDAAPPLTSKKIKVAWMTSWNSKCGIAEYSRHLAAASMNDENFETFILAQVTGDITEHDDPNVYRCWENCFTPIDRLIHTLDEIAPEVLIIQFNFGFIAMHDLSLLLGYCEENGIVTIVELHATKDVTHGDKLISLRDGQVGLGHASRILAHGLDDMNRLKEMGLVQNTCLFPLGVLDWELQELGRLPLRRELGFGKDDFIIATYGFLLPHKGLAELIEAFVEIHGQRSNAQLLMVNALYPHQVSSELHEQLSMTIAMHPFSSDIRLMTNYLEDVESLSLLQSSDVIVFPYQATAESASAAVRHGLATGKPVLCTPLPIFSELSEVVHYTSGTAPHELARTLIELMDRPDKIRNKMEAQHQWAAAHAYSRMGQRLSGMIRGLVANK